MLKVRFVLAAVISAILLALCFAGMGKQQYLVWLWALPLFGVMWGKKQRLSWRQILLISSCFGLTFWGISMRWLLEMSTMPEVSTWLARVAWLAGVSYLTAYSVLFFWLADKWKIWFWRSLEVSVWQGAVIRFLVAALVAAIWTLVEWLRSYAVSDFSWFGLSHALSGNLPLLQVCDVLGPTAFAWIPMTVNILLVQIILTLPQLLQQKATIRYREVLLIIPLVIVPFYYGMRQINKPEITSEKTLTALVVQPNIKQKLSFTSEEKLNHLIHVNSLVEQAIKAREKQQMALMQAAFAVGKQAQKTWQVKAIPDVILLPESSLYFPIFSYPKQRYAMQPTQAYWVEEVLAKSNRYLVTGGAEIAKLNSNKIENNNDYRLYNNLWLFSKKKPAASSYQLQAMRKKNLVVFGEYNPLLGHFDWLDNIVQRVLGGMINCQRGSSQQPLEIASRDNKEKLQLIPVICFEDTVRQRVRTFVRPKSQLIVNITNDAWFGVSAAALQHFDNAKLSAIACKRPMLRVANTGISTFINSQGKVIAPLLAKQQNNSYGIQPFIANWAWYQLPLITNEEITFYSRYGDWFCWVLLVFWLLAEVIYRRRYYSN